MCGVLLRSEQPLVKLSVIRITKKTMRNLSSFPFGYLEKEASFEKISDTLSKLSKSAIKLLSENYQAKATYCLLLQQILNHSWLRGGFTRDTSSDWQATELLKRSPRSSSDPDLQNPAS